MGWITGPPQELDYGACSVLQFYSNETEQIFVKIQKDLYLPNLILRMNLKEKPNKSNLAH